MEPGSYPTVEQTNRMRGMVNNSLLPAHCKTRTLIRWHHLSEAEAEDRLTELATIIKSNYATGTVPEA